MIPDQQWVMERDAFLDTPPPRHVPASVAKKAAPFEGLFLVIFGLIFLTMGLVFSWIFLPTHLPRQWRLDKGPSSSVLGTITQVENTKVSINKVSVKEYTYRFVTKDGVKKEGVAYTTGGRWRQGKKVKVSYLDADPSISVPLGARMGKADLTSSFVILFPVIGSALAIAPFIGFRRRRWLLRNGWVTKATVSALETTSVSVNHQPQFKIRVTRADDGVETMMRSHQPGVVSFAKSKKESAEPVTILYDPQKPKRMMFPEVWGREREI